MWPCSSYSQILLAFILLKGLSSGGGPQIFFSKWQLVEDSCRELAAGQVAESAAWLLRCALPLPASQPMLLEPSGLGSSWMPPSAQMACSVGVLNMFGTPCNGFLLSFPAEPKGCPTQNWRLPPLRHPLDTVILEVYRVPPAKWP